MHGNPWNLLTFWMPFQSDRKSCPPTVHTALEQLFKPLLIVRSRHSPVVKWASRLIHIPAPTATALLFLLLNFCTSQSRIRAKLPHMIMRALNRVSARASNVLLFRLIEWHLRLALTAPQVPSRVSRAAITLFATFVAACVILFPPIRAAADQFEPVETVLAGLGATYGTILALALTLSLTPIQRAGEAWSASILRLYRRDRVTHATFVSLGVLCVTSFALSVRGPAIVPVSFILAASLALLGLGLDLLRGYHAHVCRLLDPQFAVATGLKEAKRAQDSLNRVVRRNSWLRHRRPFNKRKPASSRERLESTIYLKFVPGYPGILIQPFDDLAEMALRALSRGEQPLARAAIDAIAELTNHYLSCRKRNLMLYRAAKGAAVANTSDIDHVTHPAYRLLRQISRAAVKAEDETTAIRVSYAFRSITVHTAKLAAPAFSPNTAPLSGVPLRHAFDCLKFAQSRGLEEVPYQSASILTDMIYDIPKGIPFADLYAWLVDGLHDIAAGFHSDGRFEIAEAVTKNQLLILSALSWEQTGFPKAVQEVLEKIALQVPLALENERTAEPADGYRPLKHAYDSTDMLSLAWLFGNALRWLYHTDDEPAYRDQYAQVLGIADVVSDHLRRVAKNNEFGATVLVREIDGLIKHIAIAVTDYIEDPAPFDQGNQDELVRGFIRLLAFYPSVFRDKNAIHTPRVQQCCDTVGYIGLRFLSSDRPGVLVNCVWCIESIVESYCRTAGGPDHFILGEVFALLWATREVAAARDCADIVAHLDRALAQPPDLTDDQWEQLRNPIRVGRERLLERLDETDDLPRQDRAETLLRALL